jgi:hypothetical protein
MLDLGRWAHLRPRFLCACLVLSGCTTASSGDTDAGAGECSDGKEGCACYGNSTCNTGLVCLSKLCVDRDEDDHETTGDAGPADDDTADAAMGDEDPKSDGGREREDEAPTDVNKHDASSAEDAEGGAATEVDPSTEPAPEDPVSDDVAGDDPESDMPPSQDASVEPVTNDVPEVDAGTPPEPTDPSPPTGELIRNGDFSEGTSYWNLEVPGAVVDTSSGALCLSATDEGYIYGPVGWPLDPADAFALQAGRSYLFQFEAWVSDEVGGNLEYMNAKVGEAVAPYYPVFTWDTQVGGERGTSSAQFVADADYAQVGVVFLVETAVKQLCFDNVSVVAVD